MCVDYVAEDSSSLSLTGDTRDGWQLRGRCLKLEFFGGLSLAAGHLPTLLHCGPPS